MAKIKQALNYVQSSLSFEPITDRVSKTIPDQTISIRQLLDIAKGNPPGDGLYIGDDVEENKAADIGRMELTDRNEFVKQRAEKLAKQTDELKRDITDKRTRAYRDKLKKELEQEQSKDTKKDPPEKPIVP